MTQKNLLVTAGIPWDSCRFSKLTAGESKPRCVNGSYCDRMCPQWWVAKPADDYIGEPRDLRISQPGVPLGPTF